MSEMVERVARAICKSVGFHPDAPARNHGALNDSPMWKTYQRDAVAAIKEMREPTRTMILAAELTSDKNLMTCPTIGWQCATVLYQAMIDEASK